MDGLGFKPRFFLVNAIAVRFPVSRYLLANMLELKQ